MSYRRKRRDIKSEINIIPFWMSYWFYCSFLWQQHRLLVRVFKLNFPKL